MTGFNKKTWVDRVSQYPTRRKLTNIQDNTDVNTYDVEREEGTVSTVGDAFNAATMNNLENRIKSFADSISTTSNKTYYVNGSTGNNSNTGTSSAPFKTIQHAIDILPKCIDHNIEIYISQGTYAENVSISGFRGAGNIKIVGYSGTQETASSAVNYKVNSFTIFNDKLNYVRLRGLSIVSKNTNNSAIEVSDSTSHFEIVACQEGGGYSQNTTFLKVRNFSNVYARNCSINNRDVAIHGSYYCANIVLEVCTGSGNLYAYSSEYGSTIRIVDSSRINSVSTQFIKSTAGTIIKQDSTFV